MKKILVTCATVFALVFNMCVEALASGVCTHMDQGWNVSQTIKSVKEMNFEWIRDELQWDRLERQSDGSYAIPETDMVRLNETKKAGLKLLLVLDYANLNYASSITEMPLIGTEAFGEWLSYVESVVRATKGMADAYEIWNEPDNSFFNANNASAQDYYNLLYATYNKILEIYEGEENRPPVIGGAFAFVSKNNDRFLRKFLALSPHKGATKCMDAISVHTYVFGNEGDKSPDKNYPYVLTGTQQGTYQYELNRAGYTGDVWFTETGWITGTNENSISGELQAAYYIRSNVIYEKWLKDTNRGGEFFWYDLKNDGKDLNYSEHNFGLVEDDFKPKPAYYSAKIFNELTNGKTFTNLSKNSNANTAVYTDGNGAKTYVLWNSSSDPDNVVSIRGLDLNRSCAAVYDYKGNLIRTTTANSIDIDVTGYPTFIDCYDTTVDNVEYNADKNVMKVTGRSYLSSFTLELVKNGERVNEINVKSKNDRYSVIFTPNCTGDAVLYAARKESGTYAERNVNIFANGNINSTVNDDIVTVVSDDIVTVSGTVSGAKEGEFINIAVVPASTDMNDLTNANVAYIGEAHINNGIYHTSFKMPENSEGEYKVLVNSRNSDGNAAIGMLENGSTADDIKVCSFKITGDDNITVTANANNVNAKTNTGVIVIAQYDANGRLINASSKDISVEANTVRTEEITFNAAKEEGAVGISAFVFNGFDTMKPLFAKIDLMK